MQKFSEEEIIGKGSTKLRFKDVSFSWPCGNNILNNCSFSVPSNGLWMLVGRNGCGKSTLFKVINGMLKAQAGLIYCDLKPALMFQNPDHQLLLPTCGSDLLSNLPENLTAAQCRERVRNALRQVGLDEMYSRPIHTLSGGQKQRLALAGALASESNFLLLDEPTALLDPLSQEMILSIVKKLCHRSSDPLTALWITHRLEELEAADGAAIMEDGDIGSWVNGEKLLQSLKSLAVGGGRRVGSSRFNPR